MTRYFISEISIEGFRGINNEGDPLRLRFNPDAINTVFAPNAQGKSSVFEALCYAIKGFVPKLEGMPSADSPSEYYANRFHGTSPAVIRLSLSPSDGSAPVEIKVERSTDGVRSVSSPSGHSDPEGLLHSLDNEMCLVDNRAFLRFVEDAPLARGRSFSGLLGIGQLSEFRQALETLAHGRSVSGDFGLSVLEAEIDAAVTQRESAAGQIRTEFKAITDIDLNDSTDPEGIKTSAAEALMQIAVVSPFLKATDFLEVDWDAVRGSVKDAEQSEGQAELTSIATQIASLGELAPSDDEDEEIQVVRAAAERLGECLGQTKGPAFHDLYKRALEVVKSDEWEDDKECPVCESRLDTSLDVHLESCLAEYLDSQQQAEELSRIWQGACCVDRLKRLTSSQALSIKKEVSESVGKIDLRITECEAPFQDVYTAVEILRGLEEDRTQKLATIGDRREELRQTLPPSLVSVTEQVGHGERLSEAIRKFQTHAGTASDKQAKYAKRKSWADFIKNAANSFSEAEVRLSSAKTQSLDASYKTFYGEITHNPEIVPALRKAPGSEELYLVLESFFGLSNLSAPSLLPESYRNALAISIYLSAVLENRSSNAGFIVMDDITSSFDAGHQFHLMELIRTKIGRPLNSDGPQIIMLSHDGLLEKYFDRLSGDTTWHHQKIQGLSPKGSVFSQAQNADRHRNRAEQFLNSGQVDQAELLVRQYLEFKMLQVIRKVGVPVPYDFAMRDDRKMVQTCLDAIEDAIGLHKAAGDLILSGDQLSKFETRHVPALIGNWVNHYATGVTASFTPHALLGVLDSIDSLVECFKYDCNCSGNPRRLFYKSLSAKHCSC